MHRVDTEGHKRGRFASGNPATNEKPTRIGPDWLNSVQEEICAVIEGSGKNLDKSNNKQLAEVISELRAGLASMKIETNARVFDLQGLAPNSNVEFKHGYGIPTRFLSLRIITKDTTYDARPHLVSEDATFNNIVLKIPTNAVGASSRLTIELSLPFIEKASLASVTSADLKHAATNVETALQSLDARATNIEKKLVDGIPGSPLEGEFPIKVFDLSNLKANETRAFAHSFGNTGYDYYFVTDNLGTVARMSTEDAQKFVTFRDRDVIQIKAGGWLVGKPYLKMIVYYYNISAHKVSVDSKDLRSELADLRAIDTKAASDLASARTEIEKNITNVANASKTYLTTYWAERAASNENDYSIDLKTITVPGDGTWLVEVDAWWSCPSANGDFTTTFDPGSNFEIMVLTTNDIRSRVPGFNWAVGIPNVWMAYAKVKLIVVRRGTTHTLRDWPSTTGPSLLLKSKVFYPRGRAVKFNGSISMTQIDVVG